MGLIANRTIGRGDLIKVHTSIAVFHNDAVDKSTPVFQHTKALMKAAVDPPPPFSRQLFTDMAAQNGSEEPIIERIYTNNFGEDFGEEEHSVAVLETARLNHDCRPNAMYYFDRQTLRHYTHAARTIYAGEEITLRILILSRRGCGGEQLRRGVGDLSVAFLCMSKRTSLRGSRIDGLRISRTYGCTRQE
jgi:hypothetical protein